MFNYRNSFKDEIKVKLLQNDYLQINMIDSNDIDEYSKNIHFDQFFSNLIENIDQNYGTDDKNLSSSNVYTESQNLKEELSESNQDDAIMRSKYDDDEVLILEDKIGENQRINNGIVCAEIKSEIIESSYLENRYLKAMQKLTPPVIQEIKIEDDDIFFLHEDKAPIITNQKSNYYDKDDEVDEKEVKKRWRCKTLSDHKINLSKSNYRYRIFHEKHSAQAKDRKFKKSIFENNFDTSSNINNIVGALNDNGSFSGRFKTDKTYSNIPLKQGNNRNLPIMAEISSKIVPRTVGIENSDEIIFNKRIVEIKNKYKDIEKDIKLREQEEKKGLLDVLKQQTLMLRMTFEGKKSGNHYTKNLNIEYNKQNSLNRLYLEAVEALKMDFQNEIKQNKNCEESEINALKVLFESGKYQKGKLDQYFTLETIQPAARRRRYDDNGYRQVLLPQEKLKNILIEDTIYQYYYGSP